MWFKNKNIASKLLLIFTAIVICLNLVGCGHKDNPSAVNEGEEFFSVPQPDKNNDNEIQYFIKPIIQREMFELSINVPEDYPVEILYYELWVDNERIGEITPVDRTIRHIALSKEKTDKVHIKLYNNNKNELVADCEIDPDSESGVLSF